MKTYQIHLGPKHSPLGHMIWDQDDRCFRSNNDGWDCDGSHIQEKHLASQLELAKSQSENDHGWEIKIISDDYED